MRNSVYSVSLDHALAAVGDHHRYQAFCTSLSAAFSLSFGLSLSLIWILSSDVALICPGTDHAEWVWTLPCEHKEFPRLYWGVYFLGGVVGLVALAELDVYVGRRKALISLTFLSLLTSLASGLSPWLWLFQAVLPLKGLSDISGTVLFTLYISEITAGEYRNWYLLLSLLPLYLAPVLVEIYWEFVPNWRVLLLFSMVINSISVVFTIKMTESPRHLASIQGKYSLARASLLRISTIHQKPAFTDTLEGERVIGLQEKPEQIPNLNSHSSTQASQGKLVYLRIAKDIVSVSQGDVLEAKRYYHWDLVGLQSCRTLFAVGIVAWGSVGVMGFWLGTYENPGIWRNSLWENLTDCVFTTLTALVINHTGRLGTSIVYLVVSSLCIGSFSLLSLYKCADSGLCTFIKVVEMGLFHTGRVFAKGEMWVLMLYTVEIFPTVVRFLALSLFLSLPLLLLLAIEAIFGDFRDFFLPISAVFVLISSFLTCCLPDTSVEELADYVSEDLVDMQKPTELSQGEGTGSPRA